jgi:hypothetical protein
MKEHTLMVFENTVLTEHLDLRGLEKTANEFSFIPFIRGIFVTECARTSFQSSSRKDASWNGVPEPFLVALV